MAMRRFYNGRLGNASFQGSSPTAVSNMMRKAIKAHPRYGKSIMRTRRLKDGTHGVYAGNKRVGYILGANQTRVPKRR